MPQNTNYAVGGHRGLLVIGGTQASGVRGATWSWNTQHAEGGGGWGDNHDYDVDVFQGAPTIEVDDPRWIGAQTLVSDLVNSMRSGGNAVCYLYPLGQDDLTKYFYGTFILDEPSMEMAIDDIVTLPFGLVANRPDCGHFGL